MKTKRSKLKKKLKKVKVKTTPVWLGPESPSSQGGITQSLLSRFLVCKERFRILVIEGWAPQPRFNVALDYGQMWHECEEALSAGRDWKQALLTYCRKIAKESPTDQQNILKWCRVCQEQFPRYIKFWKNHKDQKNREPVLQEESFKIPYLLPSGRTVYLRGKFDAVDLVKERKNGKPKIYLQENKTKGRFDVEKITMQLNFDLQTMLYLIALQEYQRLLQLGEYPDSPLPVQFVSTPIAGVRYNVIQRAQQVQRGGRMVNAKDVNGKDIVLKDGSKKKVRQGEESNQDYALRVGADIDKDPEKYFKRWKVEITELDITKFKEQFLDPCLEHLCMWYDYQTEGAALLPTQAESQAATVGHYRLPYGIFNPIAEGRGSDVENYLLTGSTVGLKKITNLFSELDEDDGRDS